MIPTSRADVFMDSLITLVNSDFKTVKNTDVVLLLGATGSGKSTLMCMIAGCKITATYNRKRGIYQFKAEPEIATIGHDKSLTFIPNHWEGKSLRIYDCPGFKDNRSIQHQVGKSFFIKEIADSARSIKVIVVGDIHSMFSTRCGPFGESFKQMGQLIPNFNPACDCSLIVTKAEPRNEAIQVQQTFQDQLELTIPEQRITLVYNPQVDGEYKYSYLNLDNIIENTPSLREKCKIPLSSEARLKLIEINQELNQSIERAAAAYSNAVRRYYIETITSDLSINNKTMKQLFSIIVSGEQNLTTSQNPQKFIESVKDLSEKLQQVGRTKFKYEEIYAFITKKYEQINYIKDNIDNFEFSMDYWIKNIHFQCEFFQKSQDATNLKDTDTLRAYLKDNLQIDLNSDIKSQAHAYLNKVNSFSAAYSGSKNISGYLTHNKTYTKDFEIPYVAEVKIGQYVPYNGNVKYSGSSAVTVSIMVQKCCCSSKMTKSCWFCSNAYVTKQATKTESYNGYTNYSGEKYYSGVEKQIFTAKFTDAIVEDVRIKYDESVPFSGNHTAHCRDHHTCSCQRLAQVVTAAKQLFQDISHYTKVVNFQRKELSRINKTTNQPIYEDSSVVSVYNQLSINGYKFTANGQTKNEIAAKIHDQLTAQHIFDEPFMGQTAFSISKQYSDVYDCKGSKIFVNSLTHQANVSYSGLTSYSATKTASGTMTAWTCYEDCSFCKSSSWQEPYSNNYQVSGNVNYAGIVNFSKTYAHSHELKYSEKVPFKGVISKQQKVEYEGSNKVTCASSKTIGSGHHSCTSCDTWDRFVTGLKKLLAIQSGLLSEIQSNKREIKGLVQRQEMENKRLEKELAAKTMGQ